jgi:hypothetical protein
VTVTLSPRAVRFFSAVGRLWPELVALAGIVNVYLFARLREAALLHPVLGGGAFLLFVYLTHQETPLGRSR